MSSLYTHQPSNWRPEHSLSHSVSWWWEVWSWVGKKRKKNTSQQWLLSDGWKILLIEWHLSSFFGSLLSFLSFFSRASSVHTIILFHIPTQKWIYALQWRSHHIKSLHQSTSSQIHRHQASCAHFKYFNRQTRGVMAGRKLNLSRIFAR